MKSYNALIVGAGPAGLFAAKALSEASLKAMIVEKGKDVDKRLSLKEGLVGEALPLHDIMSGVGGAGTFSDGTLNLSPDIGGNLKDYTSEKGAWELIREVDDTLASYGAPEGEAGAESGNLEELKRKASSAGATFINIPQKHIGTDHAPKLISNFKEDLVKRGVEFLLETQVGDLLVEGGVCRGVVDINGNIHRADVVLIAPGRSGASWIERMKRKHNILTQYGPVDLGVRVEVPSIIMDPVTAINRDPKFHIRTRRYDDFVRTFCTNRGGFVVKENYNDFIGVNGHCFKNIESANTNFALLVSLHLTNPLENSLKYGESVASLATTIGGGKPILQRMGDLRRGQRSTLERIERNLVRPTLLDATPGDISMAMPHRIVMDLIEALETMDRIIPGVSSDSALLYAPEIKFYSLKFVVSCDMETSLPNLFAAGDGAGLSRGIVTAAATGILAARGMIRKLKSR